jgi:hypothetical protein
VWIATGVVCILALAALAAILLFSNKPGGVAGSGGSRPADARAKLDEYNKLPADNLPERLNQFPGVEDAARKADDPALVPLVGEARQKLFAGWVAACEVKLGTADAARRGEAGADLRKLTDDYQAIHRDYPPADAGQRDKEQRWLDQYDREAELLGWRR